LGQTHDNYPMLNNISILTEDQLDDAVDQLIEAVEEYMEIYGYAVDDIDVDLVTCVANGIRVNPTPQVIDVALYRIQAMG